MYYSVNDDELNFGLNFGMIGGVPRQKLQRYGQYDQWGGVTIRRRDKRFARNNASRGMHGAGIIHDVRND